MIKYTQKSRVKNFRTFFNANHDMFSLISMCVSFRLEYFEMKRPRKNASQFQNSKQRLDDVDNI